jgi:hypothetical protein
MGEVELGCRCHKEIDSAPLRTNAWWVWRKEQTPRRAHVDCERVNFAEKGGEGLAAPI